MLDPSLAAPVRQFVVNFHGLGAPSRPFEPDEARYWVSAGQYGEVLDRLIARDPGGDFTITFDDGNLSDLRIAAPALLARRLSATFFILASKIGAPGYLAAADLRELLRLGFRIGTHGVRHVRWDSVDQATLDDEIDRSRAMLSQAVGAPINAVALPFGGYNRRVLNALEARGLREVYSSDGGPRLRATPPQPRLSVQHNVDSFLLMDAVDRMLRWPRRALVEARVTVKGWRK
jgi:peptidoglycan/xylan/chitin deacetylase (PgdA/CDA1 family)